MGWSSVEPGRRSARRSPGWTQSNGVRGRSKMAARSGTGSQDRGTRANSDGRGPDDERPVDDGRRGRGRGRSDDRGSMPRSPPRSKRRGWPRQRARSPPAIAGVDRRRRRRPRCGRGSARAARRSGLGLLEEVVSPRRSAVATAWTRSRRSLEREARAEATRERVVDRLHAELQEYKQDLLLKVQRPIFVDLIQLHDDIGKMIEARPAVGRRTRPRGRRPGHPGIDPGRDRGHPLPPGRRAVHRWRASSSIPGGSARSPRWRPTIPRSTRRSPPGCARGFRPATS